MFFEHVSCDMSVDIGALSFPPLPRCHMHFRGLGALQRLVGGITGVKPKRTVDPDRAVALGAAAFAGILEGEVRQSFSRRTRLEVTPVGNQDRLVFGVLFLFW